MKFIKENYKNVGEFLKFNLSKTILVCTLLFIVCIISGISFGMNNVDSTKGIIQSFIEGKSDILSEVGNINAIGLIKNNIVACGMSILFGFIPFIFLSIFSLGINGFLVGVVLGLGKAATGTSIIKTFILGILPHGIFEIPALIISMSMGIYLCLNLSMKVFGRGKEKISKILLEYIRLFISVILPMIIIAGIIETYITPMLLK